MPVQKGQVINPTGKGGFRDNPENRNAGFWSSKDSISFQYKKLQRLTIEQLEKWIEENPKSKRTVAEDLAYKAMVKAQKELPYLKEVTDRSEGRAPQIVDMKVDATLESTRKKIGAFLDDTDDPEDSETSEQEDTN